MKHTLRRAAGLAACALALGVTAAPLAHAETQTAKDPRGDVTTVQFRAPGGGVDVVGSTNTFEGATLKLKVRAANLTEGDAGASWLIRAGDTRYGFTVERAQGQTRVGFYEYIDGRSVVRAPQGIPICEGVTGRVKEGKDLVVGSVPRSCLGGASTVRVGSVLYRSVDAGYQVDDARRTGYDGGNPKLGPALDRS